MEFLWSVVVVGDFVFVRLFFDYGVDVNVWSRDCEGWMIIVFIKVVVLGFVEIVYLFLDVGVDVNV